jgi:hypothetical protein
VIPPAGADLASAAPNLTGARHGNVHVDTTRLLKPGDSTQVSVTYHPDKNAVFAVSPNVVSATVVGDTPYAVRVSEIDTAQFVLTLTALQTRVDGTPTAQVNWIALP